MYNIQWVKQGKSITDEEGEALRCKDRKALKIELEKWYQMINGVIRETKSRTIVQTLVPISMVMVTDFVRPTRVFSVISSHSPEYVIVYKE